MLILALGSYAKLNFEKIEYLSPMPATITVTGEGELFAVPDIGQFSFSVMAESEDVTAAQELSGTKVNSILEYLREQGIEDKDIKTLNYNLYPRYRYEERICPLGSYCPPGERVQDGFEVNQTVQVKVRETDKAPSVIAGVGERGATNISGLEFTIDDVEVLRKEAREKAIVDAQEKAAVLANQLGVKIVRLTSYNEQGGGYEPYYKAAAMAMDMEEAAGFGGAELPMGEEGTKVEVSVTYEVR